MKYYIHTYGCQMNKSDSERIAGMLESLKYKKASRENEADLVVLNTCVVRQSAQDRVYGKLKNLEKIKRQNPKFKACVTGCMASLYPEKIKDKVDLVFSIEDLSKLSQKLTIKQFNNSTIKKHEIQDHDYLSIKPSYQTKFHAYIPIMTGCNNFCSYCVVPYARGRERSRPAEDILGEVTNLVKKGYKAITLVGQNVNSYHGKCKMQSAKCKTTNQNSKTINFPKLLKMINNIPSDFWIWFITSHPKDMSNELINAIAGHDKACHYIHLPIQSGNNQILKAMNRGYTREHYINLVKKIRKKIPDLALSTDIIAGFPGETKKQFQDTVDLFKKIKFDMAYIAQYSPRPKTAAYKLKDNVSLDEKKRRKKILTNILKTTALKNNEKLIGRGLDVLVEKSKDGFEIGKTKTSKTVKFESNKNLVGQIIEIKITHATPWRLKGKINE